MQLTEKDAIDFLLFSPLSLCLLFIPLPLSVSRRIALLVPVFHLYYTCADIYLMFLVSLQWCKRGKVWPDPMQNSVFLYLSIDFVSQLF